MTAEEDGIYRFERGRVKVVVLKEGQPVLSITGIVSLNEVCKIVGKIGLDGKLVEKTTSVLTEGEKSIQNLISKGGAISDEGVIFGAPKGSVLTRGKVGPNISGFVVPEGFGKNLWYRLTINGAIAGFTIGNHGKFSPSLPSSFIGNLGGIFTNLYREKRANYPVVPGVSAARQVLVSICDGNL